ncbi:single-strand binding protein [Lishizhenia tianjinensis]|uniref:Single-stranded DNA-binding protein n=1 Tax=Lishizhenia tianjinensis TaxID=477690 RepID=A0A1I7A0L0_9FLAO|nr:single-stranded DNA-binding protein [Lishizhenia tianjinensis]SFT68427.1 single-strand binding protein [Lishizhenia tianjinensis]
MAGSVNKVILIGNLGRDPEVRMLDNNVKLCRFSIATSESYTDRNTGERRDNTEWHNVVVWRGLADVAEKYLKKGNKVYIEGKLRTRNWQDENNQTRYATEIVADNMTMLTSRAEAQSMQQNAPSPAPYNNAGTPQQPTERLANDLIDDQDDDLPF